MVQKLMLLKRVFGLETNNNWPQTSDKDFFNNNINRLKFFFYLSLLE